MISSIETQTFDELYITYSVQNKRSCESRVSNISEYKFGNAADAHSKALHFLIDNSVVKQKKNTQVFKTKDVSNFNVVFHLTSKLKAWFLGRLVKQSVYGVLPKFKAISYSFLFKRVLVGFQLN